MGYGTLDSVLSFERSNVPPTGSLILITDTLSSDGNFLIHHFIANHIRANRHVVLVGFNQLLTHYQAIGKKLVSSLTVIILTQFFAEIVTRCVINCYLGY